MLSDKLSAFHILMDVSLQPLNCAQQKKETDN